MKGVMFTMRPEQRRFEEKLARLLKEAREDAAKGWDRERILAKLRRLGANKIHCILVLKDIEGLSTLKAKVAVHKSKAWRDTREVDEKFHEQLERALIRVGKTDPAVEVKIIQPKSSTTGAKQR